MTLALPPLRRPDPRLTAAVLGGALGYFLYTLYRPGGSLGTVLQDATMFLGGSVKLTAAQAAAAEVIRQVANERGHGWLVPALVANAWRESALNPDAVGDGGHSVGLFQLHDNGAGAGMSVAARKDPRQNTVRILQEYEGSAGDPIRAARGETNRGLAALFAHHIERCAACGWSAGSSELQARRDAVDALFGPEVGGQTP